MSRNQKDSNPPIDNFNNYYQFLNNDFPSWVYFQGVYYPSVTTAYQASRVSDPNIRKKIAQAADYEQLKNIVINIKNPSNWNSKKYKVMQKLVRDKFKRNKQIAAKLIGTKERPLLNKYPSNGDNEYYWGTVPNGSGINSLGKILMAIRQQFNKGLDNERWVQQLDLQTDPLMYPTVSLVLQKEGKKIDKLFLQNKNYFMFGSAKENTFKLDHQSISKFHACIYFDSYANVNIVDLNSSNGTFLITKQQSTPKRINPLQPVELFPNMVIIFGMSSRRYIIQIERKNLEQQIAKKQKQIKGQLQNIEDLKRDPQKLSIDEIRNKIGYNLNHCVLVQNVPRQCSHRDIKDAFYKNNYNIQNVRMCIDRKTGKHEGTAIVYFRNNKDAQYVVLKSVKIQLRKKVLQVKLIDKYEAQKILNQFDVSGDRNRQNHKQKDRRQRDYDRSRDKKY